MKKYLTLVIIASVIGVSSFTAPSYGICFSDTKCVYTDDNEIISPKKQTQNGIHPDKILCKDPNYITVTKFDSIACVKPKSLEKLEKFGWNLLPNSIQNTEKNDVLIFTNKNEYKKGENITITMINIGKKELKTATSVAGFVIYTQNDERVSSWWSPNLAVGRFNPNDETTRIWDQIPNNNMPPMGGKYLCHEEPCEQVEYGTYVVKANHFLKDQIDHIPSSSFRIIE